jgi:hypothetical protein
MGGLSVPLGDAAPDVERNRVVYQARGLREEFVNGPLGVEQEFTVPRAPRVPTGQMALNIVLSGSLRSSLSANGTSVVFSGTSGGVLRYAGLSATDAQGRPLRARMRLRGNNLQLAVDTEGAVYPVTVDPLLSPYTSLTGPMGPPSESSFGSSVAISSDGDTVAIAGETDDESRGAVWVFRRAGTAWVQQGPKLTATGVPGVEWFGAQVAISADGETLLVRDRSGLVAGWVFALHDGVWQQQGPPLLPRADPRTYDVGIALAADGNTAVIVGEDEGSGVVWTYTRSRGRWKQEVRRLRWPAASEAALSADGRTLLLGSGPREEVGKAQVFRRSGARWVPDGRVISGSGGRGSASAVALSADGRTVLVGESGYALLYQRSGADWKKVAALVASQSEPDVHFGAEVALSNDGDTALISAPPVYEAPASSRGARYIFTRTKGNHWAQTETLPGVRSTVAISADGNTVFVPSSSGDPGGTSEVFKRAGAGWDKEEPVVAPDDTVSADSTSFGADFALSADGNTALIAEEDSAWVFVRSGQTWERQAQLKLAGQLRGEGAQVALSADGDTAVLVGPSATEPVAGWVFTRTGSTWSSQGTPLVAVDADPPPPGSRGQSENFASSVSISADGETVAVGAAQDDKDTGAVFVFVHSATGWTQQAPKLTASDPVAEETFGRSVAMSADGQTILVGAPDSGKESADAAYVFDYSGNAWRQSAKLTDRAKNPGPGLGLAVALSGDGNTALLSGHEHALIFTRTTAGWQQHQPPLLPYGERYGASAFGDVLALSQSGSTALVAGLPESDCGKYDDEPCSSTATVWVFTRVGETWVREPSPLVRAPSFGTNLALSGTGETALIEGVTSGPEPGGAVFVSQITPPPQTGFVTETTLKLYYGEIQQQLWSATPARFHAIALVKAPLPRHHHGGLPIYGTATATAKGPENVTLTIKPSAAIKKYLARHERLTLTLLIQDEPPAPLAASTQTLTLTMELTKPPPPEF